MTNLRWTILAITLLSFGLLVFWPHFSYPFPFHVDEWHHLTEAKRLANPADYFTWLRAEPGRAMSGLEVGFQLIILLLSKVFNVVLIYKFLPALWAIFSGLALFFVAYQKGSKNFLLAWLSLLFFMAIRTNANLTGLWFFTPLSFSFPFIFLYAYFISEGILTANRRYLFYGFFIMFGLLFCHPLSVLFSLPIIAIFDLINYRQAVKEKWLWIFSLLIFIVGVGFFALVFGKSLIAALEQIFSLLKFSRGWGVLELNNPLFELYPWPAWLWALVGMSYLLHQDQRHYSFYLLWSIVLIFSTLIYRFVGFSFFSPFQRNLYYLTLVIPLFSGYGLYYFTQKTLPSWLVNWPEKQRYSRLIGGILIVTSFLAIFAGYFNLPRESRLYKVINSDDYEAIQFLAQKPKTIVMGTLPFGTALVALTDHEPVGAINFYGSRKTVENFYRPSNCEQKQKIIESTGATIIYWPRTMKTLDCPGLKVLRQSKSSSLFSVVKIK
ncbi:MAG: hypothetical protein WC640_01590 [Candidatus Paceibacterota bacterium]|jgi:hypothetical protein